MCTCQNVSISEHSSYVMRCNWIYIVFVCACVCERERKTVPSGVNESVFCWWEKQPMRVKYEMYASEDAMFWIEIGVGTTSNTSFCILFNFFFGMYLTDISPIIRPFDIQWHDMVTSKFFNENDIIKLLDSTCTKQNKNYCRNDSCLHIES